MLLLIYFFASAAIILIAVSLVDRKSRLSVVEKKPDLVVRRPREAFFLARLLRPVNKIFLFAKEDALKQRLGTAEVKLLPEEFVLIKELVVFGLPFCLFIITGLAIEPVWLIAAAIVGFVLPEIYLNLRLGKRKAKILKELPDVLDIFSLVFNAGLDFMSGLKWIVERSKPTPLIEEFTVVLQEVNVGRSREAAFKQMAKRLNIPEISSVVRTILQGEKLGTPISEIIKILSEEVRRQRFERGQRIALQAPIKILFPLVFFILPVVAILIGGPIVIQFLESGMPTF